MATANNGTTTPVEAGLGLLTGQLGLLAARVDDLTALVEAQRREIKDLRKAIMDNAAYAERCMEDAP